MIKTAPGPNSTKRAIHHGQGLSVDFSFLVSSQRILVEEKIMLILTVRLVGSWLPIIILVCSMVRLITARYPKLSGYSNGCKFITLLWKTNISLWTKAASFILILISSTSLPIITIKFTLLELIPLIKIDQSNKLTVLLVIISVSCWLVPTLVSSSGLMHFSTISIFKIQWQWMVRTPLVSSRQLERNGTF